MASPVSKKRMRRTPATKAHPATLRNVPIDEERIKQLMKQAVREVSQEEGAQQAATAAGQGSQNEQPPRPSEDPLRGKSRDEITSLARQAEGSWMETEGSDTSVEIVRRLRDEWKHRP